MADFMPRNDADFDGWFKNFRKYVTEKTSGNNPAWTHIPKERITALTKAGDNWDSAYARYLRPHTDVDTEAKNTALTEAKNVIRPFKNNFIDDRDEVIDTDRVAMRVPLRRKTRVYGFEPFSYPELDIETSVLRELIFRYRDNGAANRAKPHGVHGLELRWEIRDTPPANVEELARVDFFTSAPFALKFAEADRGKRVWFCARWESNAGKKGPWGIIGSAIIP